MHKITWLGLIQESQVKRSKTLLLNLKCHKINTMQRKNGFMNDSYRNLRLCFTNDVRLVLENAKYNQNVQPNDGQVLQNLKIFI